MRKASVSGKTKSKTVKSATRKISKRATHKKSKTSTMQPAALNRRVLFRPDRYQYVKKLVRQEGCVFCDAARKVIGFESLCIYQSERSMIVLNKFPYNTGHLLILPKAHKGSLLDLSDNEFADLNVTLKLAMRAVQEIYVPPGMNLGLNQGRAAGAGIPDHLHYHLIPRWEGDLNFFPLIAETKVVIESLEQTYKRLYDYFKESVA